jgi:hypothetical protein
MSTCDTTAQTASFLLGALSELVEVTNSVKTCFAGSSKDVETKPVEIQRAIDFFRNVEAQSEGIRDELTRFFNEQSAKSK